MADFGDELLKIVADQRASKQGKKKMKSRTSAVLNQSGPAGSSSLGVLARLKPGCNRARRCSKDFMEKSPPMVADVERAVILDMRPAARQEELARDAAVVIRLLETALVLNDEQGGSTRDMEKLKTRNEKLEAKVLKLDNELIDLRGKQENFAAQVKELRETRDALDKAKKELGDLKDTHAEERKGLDEELGKLKSAMTPVEGKPDSVRGL
ncbi:hypothetical protein A2U01_0033225, partial [Trifolium medium]|nr:hypothetical protein [Trifolium medium]